MPPNSPRTLEYSRDVPSDHARRATYYGGPSRLPLRSPPPIPPRNYAPLPRELLSKNLDIWEAACESDERANRDLPHFTLELERSSLRQRRLATRKIAESSLSPKLHRCEPSVWRYVYRQPTLILKRKFPPTPRYRAVEHKSTGTTS
ncbi:hypothetical protein PGTUg99_037451 [Puccinia graminis f. sp. tritici]|uniref:Uncharacterized protein n=1 Tax=Puccinia graminis f. sp. tritici TaxID=56615 RepID=A0A5B0RBG3_PUCGR|nr:hypothetical protein PGTUg99_037451 [Puccinia graminis f. sp. tritici]